MPHKELEEFLSTQEDPAMSYDDIIDNIQKEKNIDLSKPKVYISNTDKFFISIMHNLKKDAESTKWKISVTPKFHDKKIDGVFLSFSKKF